MQQQAGNEAIIIGAGIGGLCAAVALRQAGFRVRVYERVEEMKEIGAGLSIWSNAMRRLERLGLAGKVREMSVPGAHGLFRTWKGEKLAELDSREMERRFGTAHVAVHRADLQAALLEAVGPGVVELGARCIGFTQNMEGVTARFEDGRETRGQLLVGADGIRSTVRAQLFGPSNPRYSGYTAWRGVTPFQHPSFPTDIAFETWGRGVRFGAVHIGGGRVYWFGTRNAPEGQQDAPEGRKQELLALFKGWHEPVEALIEATPEENILRNDIYDRKPLKRWGEGRVTLLGDAAHAMTPNLGQGACMAIEDAVALADCLKGVANIPAGLRRYEKERIRRTTPVVWQSRLFGEFARVENPALVWLRNNLMKAAPSFVQMRQLESLLKG